MATTTPTGSPDPHTSPEGRHPMTAAAPTTLTRVQGGLLDPKMLLTSLPDAARKLDPRVMVRNPVMFVVEVGAVLSTALAIQDPSLFGWSVVVWLWLTVVFANLAEAVAEGRGKAQAASLRRAKTETIARRLRDDGTEEDVPGPQLRLGDRVVVEAGQIIPGDGDVVEGVASVDESAITGESAPVIRESGGDRSSVTGGTKVLSDRIVVQITAKPGESFIDRMIALVEGASRQKTPNEIALNILLASLTIVFLMATVTLQPFAIYSGAEQSPDRAGRAAGLPDPDDHRRAAVGHRDRRDGPTRAAERAGHVRPGGGGSRGREHTAARQDRHHHPGQPAGRRVPRRAGCDRRRSGRRRSAVQPRRRDPRGPLHRGPGQDRPRAAGTCARGAPDGALRGVHRADPDERSRPRWRTADPQGRRRRGHEVGARQRRAPHRRGRRHRRRHLHRWRHPAGCGGLRQRQPRPARWG